METTTLKLSSDRKTLIKVIDKNVTHIVVPDSVTEIGNRAFSGCKSLKDIVIPNSVLAIGSWAFSGCTSLESVAIPNTVSIINSRTFVGCSSLKVKMIHGLVSQKVVNQVSKHIYCRN